MTGSKRWHWAMVLWLWWIMTIRKQVQKWFTKWWTSERLIQFSWVSSNKASRNTVGLLNHVHKNALDVGIYKKDIDLNSLQPLQPQRYSQNHRITRLLRKIGQSNHFITGLSLECNNALTPWHGNALMKWSNCMPVAPLRGGPTHTESTYPSLSEDRPFKLIMIEI